MLAARFVIKICFREMLCAFYNVTMNLASSRSRVQQARRNSGAAASTTSAAADFYSSLLGTTASTGCARSRASASVK